MQRLWDTPRDIPSIINCKVIRHLGNYNVISNPFETRLLSYDVLLYLVSLIRSVRAFPYSVVIRCMLEINTVLRIVF